MLAVTNWLKDHKFGEAFIDQDSFVENFLHHMDKGLAGEKLSMPMFRAHLKPLNTNRANQRVTVLDAGGTNLRARICAFDGNGRPALEDAQSAKMPGISTPATVSDFYNKLASISPQDAQANKRVGFCFSYMTRMDESGDGVLTSWSKGIQISGMEGEYLGQGLKKYCAQFQTSHVAVLNDTVATLVAAQLDETSNQQTSFIGYILGTGMNGAYVDPEFGIINTELPEFQDFELSHFDEKLDQASEKPNEHQLEKCCSGRYLGELTLTILQNLAPELISHKDLAKIEHEIAIDGVENATVFFNQLERSDLSDALVEICQAVFQVVTERAALLVALSLEGLIRKSDPTLARPVTINMDGSTYYLVQEYKSATEAHLKRRLPDVEIKFIKIENSPLLGAAIAAFPT